VTSVRPLLSILCFLVGAGTCIRALTLFPRLGRERTGSSPSGRSFWTGWMPGEFTPEGQRIRGRINRLLVLGWIALLVGYLLSSVTRST
jgi:hypothetical protein